MTVQQAVLRYPWEHFCAEMPCFRLNSFAHHPGGPSSVALLTGVAFRATSDELCARGRPTCYSEVLDYPADSSSRHSLCEMDTSDVTNLNGVLLKD